MNTNFTKTKKAVDPQVVLRKHEERRQEILDGIEKKTLEPTSDLMIELAFLNAILGDAPEVRCESH